MSSSCWRNDLPRQLRSGSCPEALASLPRKTPGAPAHSQRSGGGAVEDRGANESSGTPRPMPRDPPLRMARRDAARLIVFVVRLCGPSDLLWRRIAHR